MAHHDPAMEDWVNEARRADVWAVLNQVAPAHALKLRGPLAAGPCPACGGTDRFSIDRRKQLFFCRRSGKGGDAIAMVEYLTGADFLGACEEITGAPPPKGTRGKGVDQELMARRQAAAAAEAAKRDADANEFRDKEIRRAHRIWSDAGPISGSVAESYLRFRGLQPAPGAKLRSYLKLPYWVKLDDEWRVIHEGPAMVAAIQGNDGTFIGCHITYIDGSFESASGKAQVIHPQTGELLDAKKVRGSQKGGHIHLGGAHDPDDLYIGEGIETVYSVRQAIAIQHHAKMGFWSAVNLGNIGGRAADRVFHPTRTRVDKRGRESRVKVPGSIPDRTDEHVIKLPDCVRRVTILGDGDSDKFETENTLMRGAKRWSRLGRTVLAAWALPGTDFNNMWRGL